MFNWLAKKINQYLPKQEEPDIKMIGRTLEKVIRQARYETLIDMLDDVDSTLYKAYPNSKLNVNTHWKQQAHNLLPPQQCKRCNRLKGEVKRCCGKKYHKWK